MSAEKYINVPFNPSTFVHNEKQDLLMDSKCTSFSCKAILSSEAMDNLKMGVGLR
jgi:hypothetical protein